MDIPLKNLPEIGDRIKYLRHAAGLSQVEMAELAGTTQQAIQQAESGKAVRPRYLPELARALGIPHSWLALNTRPKSNKESKGLSEKDTHVLNTFHAMPKKQQDLMLELMEAQKKKSKKKR